MPFQNFINYRSRSYSWSRDRYRNIWNNYSGSYTQQFWNGRQSRNVRLSWVSNLWRIICVQIKKATKNILEATLKTIFTFINAPCITLTIYCLSRNAYSPIIQFSSCILLKRFYNSWYTWPWHLSFLSIELSVSLILSADFIFGLFQ